MPGEFSSPEQIKETLGGPVRPAARGTAGAHIAELIKTCLLYTSENDQDGGGEILQEADGRAAVVADVEIDEYKQAEAEEAVERQTGVGREDDGDDGVQSCAADPVLNPEPQACLLYTPRPPGAGRPGKRRCR